MDTINLPRPRNYYKVTASLFRTNNIAHPYILITNIQGRYFFKRSKDPLSTDWMEITQVQAQQYWDSDLFEWMGNYESDITI